MLFCIGWFIFSLLKLPFHRSYIYTGSPLRLRVQQANYNLVNTGNSSQVVFSWGLGGILVNTVPSVQRMQHALSYMRQSVHETEHSTIELYSIFAERNCLILKAVHYSLLIGWHLSWVRLSPDLRSAIVSFWHINYPADGLCGPLRRDPLHQWPQRSVMQDIRPINQSAFRISRLAAHLGSPAALIYWSAPPFSTCNYW